MAEAAALGLLLTRLLVGMTLVLAGFAKLRGGQDRFLRAVLGYELISGKLAAAVARTLPWGELLAGTLLIIGLMTSFAAVVAFLLFLVFTLAIVRSLLRGVSNDCGCFKGVEPIQWRLVYRNVTLMGLALVVAFAGGGPGAIDAAIGHPAGLHIRDVPGAAVVLALLWGVTVASVTALKWSWSRSNDQIRGHQ